MYHARLSGVPNDVALNHCGQSRTEHFVCISSADGTDYAVTVKFRVTAFEPTALLAERVQKISIYIDIFFLLYI